MVAEQAESESLLGILAFWSHGLLAIELPVHVLQVEVIPVDVLPVDVLPVEVTLVTGSLGFLLVVITGPLFLVLLLLLLVLLLLLLGLVLVALDGILAFADLSKLFLTILVGLRVGLRVGAGVGVAA